MVTLNFFFFFFRKKESKVSHVLLFELKNIAMLELNVLFIMLS